ncbi:MAG: hypothetical protein ACI9VR_003313 [Cognaticolwellia sp.]|jgi:hypothetical protein
MPPEISPPTPPLRRVAFAAGGLALGAVAVLLALLPFFLSFSGGVEGAQWELERALAGEHAYSLRHLTTAGQPFFILVPAMLSPSLQLLREALVPHWTRWRVISSGLHGLLLLMSLTGFVLLAMLSAMVATSGLGQGLIALWYVLAGVMAAVFGLRGMVTWVAPRSG